MSELEKWKSINACETQLELIKTLGTIFGKRVEGRQREFDVAKMSYDLAYFFTGDYPSTVLTRNYGIRQQAIYLKSVTKDRSE
jgi:hypothetical protein